MRVNKNLKTAEKLEQLVTDTKGYTVLDIEHSTDGKHIYWAYLATYTDSHELVDVLTLINLDNSEDYKKKVAALKLLDQSYSSLLMSNEEMATSLLEYLEKHPQPVFSYGSSLDVTVLNNTINALGGDSEFTGTPEFLYDLANIYAINGKPVSLENVAHVLSLGKSSPQTTVHTPIQDVELAQLVIERTLALNRL